MAHINQANQNRERTIPQSVSLRSNTAQCRNQGSQSTPSLVQPHSCSQSITTAWLPNNLEGWALSIYLLVCCRSHSPHRSHCANRVWFPQRRGDVEPPSTTGRTALDERRFALTRAIVDSSRAPLIENSSMAMQQMVIDRPYGYVLPVMELQS